MRRLAQIGLCLACFTPATAAAYRPFDGTDAAVCTRGELELELQPVGYLRSAGRNSLIAPATIVNLGVAESFELVLEGKHDLALGDTRDRHRSTLTDTALSLKHVFVDGFLQDKSGTSVAAEVGTLLPTWHEQPGMGAVATLIVSHLLGSAAAHVNLTGLYSRAREPGAFASLILEGPLAWRVRPVAEFAGARERRADAMASALAGLVWQTSETLSFDLAGRFAAFHADGSPQWHEFEARLGLTAGTELFH
jgi:hypothetical protein